MIVQNFVFSPKIDPVCSLGHNDGCLLPLQGLGVVAVVVVEGGEEVEHGEEGEEGAEEDSGVGVVEVDSKVREAVVECGGEGEGE